MTEPVKPYTLHKIDEERTCRTIAPAGWYRCDDGRLLHLTVATEVDEVQRFVFADGVGRWIHHQYTWGVIVPLPPPPPKPPGFFARLWARLRGRRLPQARLLPGPRPKVPSTVAEVLDEWSGW